MLLAFIFDDVVQIILISCCQTSLLVDLKVFRDIRTMRLVTFCFMTFDWSTILK